MAFNREQVDRLLKMLQQTRDVELTCPECLAQLDAYAQTVLDGAPLDAPLTLVRQHLESCPFCNEECEVILETLRGIEP